MQRRILTFAMNLLVVLAVLLTLFVIVRYFGVLAHSSAGVIFVRALRRAVPNLHVMSARSLYGGVFDGNAAATVIIVLVLEWGLSVARARLVMPETDSGRADGWANGRSRR